MGFWRVTGVSYIIEKASYWFTKRSGFPPLMVSSKFCLLVSIIYILS
jgi:hypothetical protein